MAREKTPQELEAERDVAPTVVRRDRPLRVRRTPKIQLSTSGRDASDRLLSRRVSEVTDERQEMEGLLKATIKNKLRDLNNKSLEKTLTAEGITSQKEWAKAQEHRDRQMDELLAGFDSDELKLVETDIEASTVNFMGTGSRHVANQMHIAGKREYQKLQAGMKDDLIKKSAAYVGQGSKKSDFYKDVQDLRNHRGAFFEAVAREAKMNGDSLSVIKEKIKATMTGLVEGAVDYNLGNGKQNNAETIFKDMKDYIDPERHDEIQEKLARGKENKDDDIAQMILNNAVAISKGDPKRLAEIIRKSVGNNFDLNKKVHQAFNIYKSYRGFQVEQERNETLSSVNDMIYNNHRNRVPWSSTLRQINKSIDDGNSRFAEMFPLTKRKEVVSMALDVYKNKKVITDPRKASQLMYESIMSPRAFVKHNFDDPAVTKGLNYETIQELKRKKNEVERNLTKPPPAMAWEGLKDRMEEIALHLPEDQQADFIMREYGNIYGLMNENKFDTRAMTEMLRKYDEFEAKEKPWFWHRFADEFIPWYENAQMKEFRSQLKGRDFSYYKNIDLLKKAEGEDMANKIMDQMQSNHLKRQKLKNVRNPKLLTPAQLDDMLGTYMAKKGYGKK